MTRAAQVELEEVRARPMELQFDHVSFRRDGAVVLSDLHETVHPGAVLTLVGRSGAGKSTVLKLVNRLLEPSGGAVRVDGLDTRRWNPYVLRRRVGYVIQEAGLFPHMTVEQNVGTVPALEMWERGRIVERVGALLELVGLPPGRFAARWPHELSSGERQRVGVARALALDPPVLLMDEPFGALDAVTRAALHREFRAIQARLRKTVILVTHDIAEAFALGDEVGVLDEGRLIARGSPLDIAASTDPRVRLFLATVPTVPLPAREVS
jgi:osmoprotectant transport system ATP-binding protein